MEKLELKRPYISVKRPEGASYGGSQMWDEDKTMRDVGCGVIAGTDLLLYLTGRQSLSGEQYSENARQMRRRFPPVPRHGVDGLRLALGMNQCLRQNGLPMHARWCTSGEKLWFRLREMLENDIPVVLAIGPNFPAVWKKEKLPLYRKTEAGFVEDCRTQGHYVTVTGEEGEWLRVSSWGRRLYIRRIEFVRYVRENSSWLFSNILYVKRI